MKITKSQLNLLFIFLILILTIAFIYFIDNKYVRSTTSEHLGLKSTATEKIYSLTKTSILCGLLLIASIPTYFVLRKKIRDK